MIRVALPPVIDDNALRGLDPKAPVVALSGQTMGTVWRVRAVWPQGLDSADLREAIAARLDDLVRQMSHWQADSELCLFNNLQGGEWASLSPDFAHVMAASLDLAQASGGAFSPAMGRLVDRWGFGPPGPVAAPPGDGEITALRPSCDVSRLAWDGAAARLRQPGGVSLDLSGIAKGYGVDALAAMLRAMGVRHGLVEVGGELSGWGVQSDGQPWWVDLENPAGVAPLRIALHGLAVATSGTYVRGGHNLDPATGRPAQSGVLACSVIHSEAMIADGWASAMSVLGPDRGRELADRRGLSVRWVMEDGSEVLSATLVDMIAN
ncbi:MULTISPECIES: FAD:protein FMN transferase [unclassified Novosphingobium]|uniref:FAD:protein FMN transferase n=1 Tax=unclassified Novosphingobium TaxID=2644732 RepID=UPI000A808D6B|nr:MULTISPECIES: FAD:protein FMN transferase [unclassified Novosphingobium]MDR6707996.1 thiamine biosynthesis lipoprotein [Novosphingobium sp. 1748]